MQRAFRAQKYTIVCLPYRPTTQKNMRAVVYAQLHIGLACSKCSKLGRYTGFVKATGGLSQPGRSPDCNSIVFALFGEN